MNTRYYESPETTLVEMKTEGVLCGSTTIPSGSNETWGYEEL